jgi:alanyl-tRNA synthetase
MRSDHIRSTFLEFFADRGHHQVASSSLIPDDPNLLLANAGMNQFVPVFLGETIPDHPNATSVQKCVRTVDIDNVGRTARHGTFFEMLGNFSFGGYFKREAIAWARDLLVDGFELDPDRLWVTVYRDDDEAVALWRDIGMPAERIQRLGMADNYWSMGVPGPCGPSSEVFYDRGPAFGREGGPAVDTERYLELWGLVFTQFIRGEGPDDDFPIIGELPRRNIDTGLGLDRLAVVLQGVHDVCETDLLAPTLHTVAQLAGRAPHHGADGGMSLRVVTDHARAAAFLIADGVLPSRDGRGYVLRRLLRRAARHALLLGIDDAALPVAAAAVVATLGDAWPELTAHAGLIEQVVGAEARRFHRTLRRGMPRLDRAIAEARRSGTPLAGDVAFALHDTHGVPIDLTVEAAADAGLGVDRERFDALMRRQRERARTARRR